LRPAFRVLANSADITATIASRLKSLRLTDEAGTTADTLEIDLADHVDGAPIAMPETGAELEVFIGYDDDVQPKGLFICDEVELTGPPAALVIRARAAPYEKSKGGKSDLQTQKSRSWKAGTKVGDLVRKIASEHGMEPVVSQALAGITLPHTDQSSESDINLLHRLAKRYDAIAKPAGGKLLFVKRGDAKSAGGEDMPTVALTPDVCTSWRVLVARRDSAGTTVAYYRDTRAAKRKEVSVGSGDPVRRLRLQYKDQASAKAAAEAEQRKRARSERTLSVTMPGEPSLSAESLLTMEGFRDGVAGEWLVNRVEHYIGPDGYRCTVEAEKPNADGEVAGSTGKVEDADQNGAEEGDS